MDHELLSRIRVSTNLLLRAVFSSELREPDLDAGWLSGPIPDFSHSCLFLKSAELEMSYNRVRPIVSARSIVM